MNIYENQATVDIHKNKKAMTCVIAFYKIYHSIFLLSLCDRNPVVFLVCEIFKRWFDLETFI